MARLEIGDKIKIDGQIGIEALEPGFKYRVDGFKTFKGVKVYVLESLTIDGDYSKVPVKELDDVMSDNLGVEAL